MMAITTSNSTRVNARGLPRGDADRGKVFMKASWNAGGPNVQSFARLNQFLAMSISPSAANEHLARK
jgi:hypothetical protein